MRLVFNITWFILLSLAQVTGQINVTTSVDSSEMVIGDQNRLKLLVRSNTSLQDLALDMSNFDTIPALEIITQSTWQSTGTNYLFDLQFGVFDTGYVWIPAMKITFTADNIPDTTFSQSIPVLVKGVSIDSTGLAPIKEIITEPRTIQDWWPYLAIPLGLILILMLIQLLKKRRSKPPTVAPPPVYIPPHQQAMDALNVLKEKKLWQQGHIKAYHSELTYILRNYLERKFEILALESTTAEIKNQIRDKINPEHLDSLGIILNQADLVKFAKGKPPIEVHQQVLDTAEAWILDTNRAYHQVTEEEEE